MQSAEISVNEETTPIKSYKLVTDELVKDALKNDKGEDAELLSWKIKPFTKRGDNFSSIVVQIEVKYHKNGTELGDSFIAKINPLREGGAFIEIMEESYARETLILSSIIEGMNKHLENLRIDKIKTPKLFSRNLEKGKEVFLIEDLSKQGFKMHDRKIGMDLNHALLVVKEIGRFHASSILFEEELSPKTLLEAFPDFKRSWLDRNHSSFEMFARLFNSQSGDARNFLQNAGPKYEKCVKWLSEHGHEIIEFFCAAFSPKKSFNVIIHGDCWANNMLFRYNEDGIPVDVRLVDLQLCAKASPLVDLFYFFYSSINGDFRWENMNTLVTSYYESFLYVLKKAGKEPPFTYMELKQEIKNGKSFAFSCGVLLLPIVLSNEDELFDVEAFVSGADEKFSENQSKKFEKLAQKEGPFKDRFLTLFDEMIENNLFNEGSEEIEETGQIKSYELVTDDLVRDALKNDKGPDVELLSWVIKPFTKKGDNYSSIVVSIEVKYHKNGRDFKDSFIAKINPLRQINSYTEVMEEYFDRETIILSSIIGGINKHMENLRLDKIKIPKLFSQNLEKGKEIFLIEDLRKQDFKMHDRKIGMDLNHALLVVKEIGRLHAGSIIFEEELCPKTLLETFPGFKRSFLDPNHESFDMFRKFFITEAENASSILQKQGPKYEKCVKWLSNHSHEIIDIFKDVFSPQKPFDVLLHGDCWTNNMLFRYNEDGIPVDIRFVDLQLSAKATPVADLNYYLYSSINGDLRLQNMNTLITAYYESFCDVLRRARMEPPFTYTELKQEMKNRKLHGFSCGLLLLPILLAEGDEILDIENFTSDAMEDFNEEQSHKFKKLAKKGPFSERYLALFDEMLESNIFDEVEDSIHTKSYKLVTVQLVKEAVKNDKGSDAELLSFEVKPFTNLGDNYSSIVVSIEVSYKKNGTELQDSFVAKLNPLRAVSDFTEIMEELYVRETVVLSSIIGGMNKHLQTLKLDKIKTPKLFSRCIEKGKEAFVTENLRKQGFKMYDRRNGMDLNHSLLVVKEIGRFHASSILLEDEIYPKTILETFPGFKRTYLDRNHSSFEGYSKMFSGSAENTRNFLKNADPKYEKCVKWLTKHSHEMIDFFAEVFSSKKPFDVLLHCDCWTNNMLFRHNEDEIPVDIRFVDLQLSFKGTPAADLNYFFYTSLNGDFRLENLNTMLTTYYESFCSVLNRAGKEPPFTYTELKQEIKDKRIFGLTSALLVLPIILAEGDEMFDIDNFTSDGMDEFNENQSKKFEKMAQREGPFKDRFLAVFDELVESNVFDES